MAACGALDALGLECREALWAAGPLASEHRGVRRAAPARGIGGKTLSATEATPSMPWVAPPLPGTVVGAKAPRLPPMPATERTVADLALTGTTTGAHPMAYLRVALSEQSVLRAADVPYVPDGTRDSPAAAPHRRRHRPGGRVWTAQHHLCPGHVAVLPRNRATGQRLGGAWDRGVSRCRHRHPGRLTRSSPPASPQPAAATGVEPIWTQPGSGLIQGASPRGAKIR